MVDYDKWRKMAVKDQDRESVGDFYGVSMDILSKSMHVQQAISVPEEDTKFSITPKKIKIVSAYKSSCYHTYTYRTIVVFLLSKKYISWLINEL